MNEQISGGGKKCNVSHPAYYTSQGFKFSTAEHNTEQWPGMWLPKLSTNIVYFQPPFEHLEHFYSLIIFIISILQQIYIYYDYVINTISGNSVKVLDKMILLCVLFIEILFLSNSSILKKFLWPTQRCITYNT